MPEDRVGYHKTPNHAVHKGHQGNTKDYLFTFVYLVSFVVAAFMFLTIAIQVKRGPDFGDIL